MRKLFLLCSICLSFICLQLQAQENKLGYFNSLSIGANIGTTGWGIDIATPIGQHFAVRAGLTIMPNFSTCMARPHPVVGICAELTD